MRCTVSKGDCLGLRNSLIAASQNQCSPDLLPPHLSCVAGQMADFCLQDIQVHPYQYVQQDVVIKLGHVTSERTQQQELTCFAVACGFQHEEVS